MKMDTKKVQKNQSNRFLKLSLKKNRLKHDLETKRLNRSSDVIIIDESLERLQVSPKIVMEQKIYSPIVINDSSEISFNNDSSHIQSEKVPSTSGNLNNYTSKEATHSTSIYENDASILSIVNNTTPSMKGWSPSQNIICSSPKYNMTPSIPNEVANESIEECSIEKIQRSQKKLLNELYGEQWKSLPALFKTIKKKYKNLNGISKKLEFDDDSDKENLRKQFRENKQLYLTGSDAKTKTTSYPETEKRSKKKLYTEIIPNTPKPPKQNVLRPERNVNSTTKKEQIRENKQLYLTGSDGKTKTTSYPETEKRSKKQLYTEITPNTPVTPKQNPLRPERNVNSTTKKVKRKTDKEIDENINVLTKNIDGIALSSSSTRLSFLASLAGDVPPWRCHPEAIQYRDNYKSLREKLTRRLYVEYNTVVFKDALEADFPIIWDTKLRSTAGTTINRLIKKSNGERIRVSSIKLSTKVLDVPERLRNTLIHELCHAATWLVDGELKAGHGPLWKKWATRALLIFPELGEINRCHDMEIHYRYLYKCTRCSYSIKRHSKSIDVTKKLCGICGGDFEVIVNRKRKDGLVVSTPARKAAPNVFALYVKDNYNTVKEGRTHAQVMKLLGEQYSAKKNKKMSE